MAEVRAIPVDEWSIAHGNETGDTLLTLTFPDRSPIYLLIPKERATSIAGAILEQYANPPPRRDRPS